MGKKMKILVAFLLGFFFIGFLGIYLGPAFVFGPMFEGPIAYEPLNSADYGVVSQITMLRSEDGYDIATYLVEAKKPKGVLVLLSGIHSPPVQAFYGYSRMFQVWGYSTLLVEMRSHGESSGEFISLGMKEWMDVKAGVDYLDSLPAYASLPIVALGTSMGGATALIAAGELSRIDGVISIAAYSSPVEMFVDAGVLWYGLPEKLSTALSFSLNRYFKRKIGSEALKYTPLRGIKKLGNRPLLLMHSTEDDQVPFVNYERLLAAAPPNTMTFTREKAGHFVIKDDLFDTPEKDEDFAEALLTFLNSL